MFHIIKIVIFERNQLFGQGLIQGGVQRWQCPAPRPVKGGAKPSPELRAIPLFKSETEE